MCSSDLAGLGPVVLTAGEIRRKEELLTNLGEDDEDDFMEDLNIDSFEPFQYKPEADVGKLEKISYGPFTRLNKRLKVVCARFEDVFSMTLPREPANLPPFPVTINREKWEVAKNRRLPRVQSAFKEVKIRESTDDLSSTGIIEPSDAEFIVRQSLPQNLIQILLIGDSVLIIER